MAQKCQEKSKSTLFYWSNGYHLSITPNAYSINQSKSTLKVDSHQIIQQHTIYMAGFGPIVSFQPPSLNLFFVPRMSLDSRRNL